MPASVPVPETVDRSPVLISAPLPARPGEAPGHAVVCDRGIRAVAPFEVWLVRTADDGRSWRASPRGAWRTLVAAQAQLHTAAA